MVQWMAHKQRISIPRQINQTKITEFEYGISEIKNWKPWWFDFQECFDAFKIRVKSYRSRMSLTIPDRQDKERTDKSFIKKKL